MAAPASTPLENVSKPSVVTLPAPRAQTTVFQNEYVMEHVFSYFQPVAFFSGIMEVFDIGQPTRKALLFACLTCKSWVKPALTLLWRTMIFITPIFKILPKFVKVNDSYTLTGPIEQAHKVRFEMYTRKIQVIWIDSLPEVIASHCIFRLLNMPGLSLFPALRTINLPTLLAQYKDGNAANFSPLFLANGNSLSSVTIGQINSQNGSMISSLLIHLSQRSPSIRNINLSGNLLSSEILDPLKNFGRLDSLRLIGPSNSKISEVLRVLYCLPHLHWLYLGLGETILDDTPGSLISCKTRGFQALRVLILEGIPREMGKILDVVCETPALRAVTLLFTTETNTSIPLQRHIAEACRIAPNMSEFVLDGVRKAGVHTDSFPSNLLDPLIKCRQLANFQIGRVLTPLIDDQIRRIGESGTWRNLLTLSLPPSGVQGTALSLTSLRIIAQSCPRLTRLTIAIDFKLHTPSSLQEERRHPRTTHPLKLLSVLKHDSPNTVARIADLKDFIQMATAVARFLEHFFPNLSDSKISTNCAHPVDVFWWNMVKNNMAEYRGLRAEAKAETESEMKQQSSIEA